jgi:hypothetical protein
MPDEVKPEVPCAPASLGGAPLVSPTGAPVVSPRLVPYFSAGLFISSALAGASQLGLGLPPQAFAWSALAAIIFAGLLGTTPGARKGGAP